MKSLISKTIFLLAVCTFCTFPFVSLGQLIDNAKGKVFTDRPFFNEEVIRTKGIKSISGKEIHYKLGDKPRETEYFQSYIFNQKGQLVQQFESVELTKEADTLVTYYDYDHTGNIVAIRQRDGYGNYAYLFKYDDKGRVVNEEYRQELSSFPIKEPNYLLGKRFIVSSEKSTYEDFGSTQKRTFYSNNFGYKSIISKYSSDGLIIEEVERLERMPGFKTTQYHYNRKNVLDSITIRSSIAGAQNRSFVYGYDKHGNLVKKEEFKNGNYVKQYQVLYDEESSLIDDVLVQHISSDFIKVLELRMYSYF